MSLGRSLQGMNLYQGRFTSGMEYLTPGGEIDFRWYRQFNSSEFNNMGLACEFVGQPEEALNWYIQSVNMNPDFDLAWFNLGLLSARLGNYPQRDKALLKLHTLNPALANKLTGDIRPDRSVR
jgi:tetratricopeptide (TPR) repeat protein